MSYNTLLILVEGSDDQDFITALIKPLLEGEDKHYNHVQVITYKQRDNSYLRKLIKSYKSMGAKLWFLCDLDSTPCFTRKKDIIKNKYPFVEASTVLIAQMEIESWYAAGITREISDQLGIPYIPDTSSFTKEQFNNLIPPSALSRKSFMIDVLHEFSIDEAKLNNESLRYCFAKLLPPTTK